MGKKPSPEGLKKWLPLADEQWTKLTKGGGIKKQQKGLQEYYGVKIRTKANPDVDPSRAYTQVKNQPVGKKEAKVGYIGEEDMGIFHITDDPAEAANIIIYEAQEKGILT